MPPFDSTLAQGSDRLALRFEAQRPRLLSVAYRMLGSVTEAEDAVQDAWLRLHRTDDREIDDVSAWLTTVVARLALNRLRSRRTRRETHVPEPIVDRVDGPTPEHAALLADGIGVALLVVLDTLTPAERVAFVLHDVFDMSFDEIASIVERTPEAARQLASRARRRVQTHDANPGADIELRRNVVDAFLAAANDGDYERLVAVLDPGVVLRKDGGAKQGGVDVHGAEQVARGATTFSRIGLVRRPALVNGHPGAVCTLEGKLFAVMAFTVRGGKIAEIDILTDVEELAELDVAVLDT